MRPIWTGSLSFGLVNIPVKLYLAAKSERIGFRLLHKTDGATIQFRRFCSLEEKEVPYEEIARGFEYEKGHFLEVTEEDLARIPRAASRVVDIQQFVGRGEIPAVFFETPYFLEPVKGAERAYALLREALRRAQKVGIARVALRDREYVAAVHVSDSALMLSTLRYAAELRDPSSLGIPAEDASLPEKQLDLALMLVDQLSSPFDPKAYRDDADERVAKMIQEKLAGQPPPQLPALPPAVQVVDLADVLQRSIEEAGRKGPARQPAARPGPEAPQAGERRAPRAAAARASPRRRK